VDNFPIHAVIGFRLDVDLRMSVQLRLHQTGMTVSEYMRWLIRQDTPRLLNPALLEIPCESVQKAA